MAASPKEYFETDIAKKLEDNPDFASSINGVYQFDITGDDGGQWVLKLDEAPGAITEGTIDEPGCTITMKSEDFMNLITGKLNGQMAFMTGKLKVKGNMQLAMKLQKVLG